MWQWREKGRYAVAVAQPPGRPLGRAHSMTVMESSKILVDAFERIRDAVHRSVRSLSAEDLVHRPYPEGNTIAWLIWHLTRVQDDHMSDVAGRPQVWTADGFARRFALPFEESATGYGHASDEVAAVDASAELLLEYHDMVCGRSVAYVSRLKAEDLDRVVDESWDPPVTLGVRLVSVISDDLQHVGQAAYIRGLLLAR
jgi:hypothetical protein